MFTWDLRLLSSYALTYFERIAEVFSFGIVLKLTVKLSWDSFADEQVVIALLNGMSIHFDDNWFEWPLETSDGSIGKTFSVSEK